MEGDQEPATNRKINRIQKEKRKTTPESKEKVFTKTNKN